MNTDEELALSIQQGNRRALAQLVERHHSPLLGFLYRMTNGNRPLAEDLAQEAFLRVLRNIAHYAYPRPFKAWLYATATNLVRDHFRRADTRRTQPADTGLLRQFSDERAGPEAAAILSDEAQRVAAALKALPNHQREAIILRYYHDFSLAEIADTLDIPVGTVKSRLSLGLKRLRALWEEGES